MGVPSFLSHVLEFAGEPMDVSELANGILVHNVRHTTTTATTATTAANAATTVAAAISTSTATSANPSSSSSTTSSNDTNLSDHSTTTANSTTRADSQHHQATTSTTTSPHNPNCENGNCARGRKHRRPLRIGVDISAWIQRAAHGFADLLGNEQYLSNYGRAMLQQQLQQQQQQQVQQQQQQQKQQEASSSDDEAIILQQRHQLQQQQQKGKLDSPRRHLQDDNVDAAQRLQEYTCACTNYIVKRIQELQHYSKAEILVVLDGDTPAIKLDEVRKRRGKRLQYERERDALLDATTCFPTNNNNNNNNNKSNQQHEEQTDGMVVALDEPDEDENDAPATEQEQQDKLFKAYRRVGAGMHYTEILMRLVQQLRQSQICFMVAPYEADGQLAYLSNKGYIDLIITDDSDLVAHGASCIYYKYTTNSTSNHATFNSMTQSTTTGTTTTTTTTTIPKGILLRRSNLGCVLGSCSTNRKMQTKSSSLQTTSLLESTVETPTYWSRICFQDFSPAMMAVSFVASGCDYCPKLRGIGLITASRIVHDAFLLPRVSHDESSLSIVFRQLFRYSYGTPYTEEERQQYEDRFLGALLVYRHPIVYDPIQQQCIIVGSKDHFTTSSSSSSNISTNASVSVSNNANPYGEESEIIIVGDPELVEHEAYAKLCSDPIQRARVIGELCQDRMRATALAEGLGIEERYKRQKQQKQHRMVRPRKSRGTTVSAAATTQPTRETAKSTKAVGKQEAANYPNAWKIQQAIDLVDSDETVTFDTNKSQGDRQDDDADNSSNDEFSHNTQPM